MNDPHIDPDGGEYQRRERCSEDSIWFAAVAGSFALFLAGALFVWALPWSAIFMAVLVLYWLVIFIIVKGAR